jgi:hypothetical protein
LKNTIIAGAAALSLVALVTGCGATGTTGSNGTTGSAGANAANGTNSATAPNMNAQYVSVTASAQAAMDDFVTGKSLLGPMDTKTINGTSYAVVASSKSDLDTLEKAYLDFLTQSQINVMFSHVQDIKGQYVFQPMKSSGDTNDWFKATVKSVTKESDGYNVTLSVPQTDGGSAQMRSAILVQNSSGHYVYAGS